MSRHWNSGPMQQVEPLLWIGNIAAAEDADTLKANNIHSVLSVFDGHVQVHPTLMKHHIRINDMEDADLLSFLPPAVGFIEKEIEKGRGVLVHCLAGVSRSATVVAAYLMYSRNLDAAAAIKRIAAVRPQIGPNAGFLRQLDIFHEASHKLSLQDKSTRMYYLDQAVKRIQNGYPVSTAEFTNTTAHEESSTSMSQRRIRCKKCRQVLAGRENMLGHRLPETLPPSGAVDDGVKSPALDTTAPPEMPTTGDKGDKSEISLPAPLDGIKSALRPSVGRDIAHSGDSLPLPPSSQKPLSQPDFEPSKSTSEELSQYLSDALTLEENTSQDTAKSPVPISSASHTDSLIIASASAPTIALRGLRLTALPFNTIPGLAGDTCSGYFLAPMRWMDSFLDGGALSGKIVCPNQRCKAKVGNYDWAGMHCSCHDWVVPGFCISRSKVDEITIM